MIRRYPTPSRDVTPFEEDMTDYFKESAYRYHDTLIEMGGRPTRPVLEQPAGKAVYREQEGRIDILDEHGKLTCTLGYDMSPTHHHWTEECSRFEEELDGWKEFQSYQRNNPQPSPLETAFDLRDTDQALKAALVRLNEWREFEVYHEDKVNTALMATWRNERVLRRLFEEEAMSDPIEQLFHEEAISVRPLSEIQSKIGTWLEQLYPKQRALEASQKQLTCIEKQGFEILSEVCARLEGAPLLCQQLEKKMEEQTHGVYQELELLKARPSRAAQVSSSTASSVQRILHWKSETSRLMKECREWKMFLKWRKRQTIEITSVTAEEQASNGRRLDPTIWLDYVTYREAEVDKARSYVVCWQRLQRSAEKRFKYLTKAGIPTLGGCVESIQRMVERFQQDARTAEAQLRSAQQQLAELSLQQASSASQGGTNQSPIEQRLPPSPPDSNETGSRPDARDHFDFRIFPTNAHRPLPADEVSESVHPSSIPNQIGFKREKGNVDKGQLSTVAEDGLPDQVTFDEDIQMTDVTDDPYLHEVVGEGKGAESTDTHMSDVKDPVNSVNPGSPLAPKLRSKGRNTRATRKSSLIIHQVSTSRKTRSATKLDQAISNRIPKSIGKKPAKKVKVFTEHQTETLLNAASISYPPTTEPPTLRRSERLRKQAEVLANMSPSPQLNVAQSQSSMQKNLKKQPSLVEPSQSSKQKKPKVQANALESRQTSSRKRPRIQHDTVESSRSSRQKRIKTEARDHIRQSL